jgi:benzoate membrane transport protein
MPPFIGVLGGLALFRALQGWMASAFGGDLSLGALAAFLVTLSGVSIFHIGSPFWGLVFGVAIKLARGAGDVAKSMAGKPQKQRRSTSSPLN